MKVALVYPPFQKDGEYPLISQNRQFKFSNSLEVRIFPLVMGTLATMLKEDGHEVLFLDGVNERLDMAGFEKQLFDFKPELVVLETKTPIVYDSWEYIARLKENIDGVKTALVGDHVCFFPEESLEKSKTDFAIEGGDYDFIIRDLVRVLSAAGDSCEYPGGAVYRDAEGNAKRTSPVKMYPLDNMPYIDRDLCKWYNYGEAYLYRPAAYILSGRGCGRPDGGSGVCSFCIWQHSFWKASSRLRPVEELVGEIKKLVVDYKVKEVFDDNEGGFIYDEEYTERFYEQMLKENLIGKVKISQNARADALTDNVCKLLKKMGGRLLKIGVESANDKTLEKIHKKENAQQIREGIKRAKDHGLRVLLTNMVGYPWETEADVQQSYENLKELMLYKTHFGDSLQASIVVAYPGTPIHSLAEKNSWLNVNSDNYRNYDMEQDILKTDIDTTYWCRKFWAIHQHPMFLMKSFFSIRSLDDLQLAFRGVRSLLGHLKDY